MKITPLDIQQQQFKRTIRGFDIYEVDAFLNLVAGEFEELLRENNRLKEDLKKREQELSVLKSQEESIKSSLLSIQSITDNVKLNARKEADLIIAEAKLQSKKIISDAQAEMDELRRQCTGLRSQRMQIEASIRSVIQSHLNLLEAEGRMEEQIETENNILQEKIR
ncbi:MAG: DivIVA domain-containing protein [Deltaproteobacteria bacterium]|nr:DivIVA domain-containing protein [Deltaproteobacteria bacterium]MBW2308603.1 DivIVA domain-containing protein [Deltaproteobacteria bacterium]